FFLLTWVWAGPDLLSNFQLELIREKSNVRMLALLMALFRQAGFLFVPFVVILFLRPRAWHFAILLFGFGLLIGGLAARGEGVGENAWFDLVIGASLLSGWLFAEAQRTSGWSGWLQKAALVGSLIALLVASFLVGDLPWARSYRALARNGRQF